MYAEDTTADVVLAAYASGQRLFSGIAVPDDSDLSGCCLEGATFQECFMSSVNLMRSSLRGTAFRSCNLKCTDFDDADLTDALIEKCSMEGVLALRCKVDGLRVQNCGYHSSTDYELRDFIKFAVNYPDR